MHKGPLLFLTNGCTPTVEESGDVVVLINEDGQEVRLSKILVRRMHSILAMGDRIELPARGAA